MKYTQETISKYFENKENKILFWGPDDSVVFDEEYFAMDYLSLFFSLSGTIQIVTDFRTWQAGPRDMQFFAFDKLVKISSASEDYRSVGLLFSRKSWAKELLYSYPSLSLTLIRPVIPIGSDLKEIIMDFMDQIRKFKQERRKDDNPVFVNTVMGLLKYVSKACEESLVENPECADCRIVSKFSRLLFTHYKEERGVDFYASQLHLSPSHFSSIIKQTTGMTVGHCIRQYVILKICSELKNTDKTIKELSIDMNFGDVSYFCKFFRKTMGVSPEEFRHGKLKEE